jgi:IS5 family transposase
VYAESGFVHTVTTTAANVADVAQLLHGKEKTVHADAGYIGAQKRAPKRDRKWHISAKRIRVKAMPEDELKQATQHLEYIKVAVCPKVEHPFRVVKRQFGYHKVRFKGLTKNTAQILTLFAPTVRKTGNT